RTQPTVFSHHWISPASGTPVYSLLAPMSLHKALFMRRAPFVPSKRIKRLKTAESIAVRILDTRIPGNDPLARIYVKVGANAPSVDTNVCLLLEAGFCASQRSSLSNTQ